MAQELPQRLDDEAQVVGDGAHGGVNLIAEAAFEVVTVQMAVGFAMTDDGRYGGSGPQFASDLAVDAALLARMEDPVGDWHRPAR